MEAIALIKSQQQLSKEEKKVQADHFLSFKNQRSFHKVECFTDHYKLMKELGSGAFGTVQLGEHKHSGVPCAIKIIKKSSLMVANVYKELN